MDCRECTAFLRVIQRFLGVFGRPFNLSSRFVLTNGDLVVARMCWKLLNPLFPLSVKGSSVQVNRNSAQRTKFLHVAACGRLQGLLKDPHSGVEILLRDVGYTRRVVLAKCHSMLDFLV